MKNLLQETLQEIAIIDKTPQDITYIGSHDGEYSCAWEEFTKLADMEYDASYGGTEVATDLTIVFNDGTRLLRGEYDGSEWWEPIIPIEKRENRKPIKRLINRNHSGTIELIQED